MLNGGSAAPLRGKAVVGAAAAAVLLLIGVSGYTFFRHLVEQPVQRAELKWEEERRAAEANRKVQQAEDQRLAAVKADRNAKQEQRPRRTQSARRRRLSDSGSLLLRRTRNAKQEQRLRRKQTTRLT